MTSQAATDAAGPARLGRRRYLWVILAAILLLVGGVVPGLAPVPLCDSNGPTAWAWLGSFFVAVPVGAAIVVWRAIVRLRSHGKRAVVAVIGALALGVLLIFAALLLAMLVSIALYGLVMC